MPAGVQRPFGCRGLSWPNPGTILGQTRTGIWHNGKTAVLSSEPCVTLSHLCMQRMHTVSTMLHFPMASLVTHLEMHTATDAWTNSEGSGSSNFHCWQGLHKQWSMHSGQMAEYRSLLCCAVLCCAVLWTHYQHDPTVRWEASTAWHQCNRWKIRGVP